MSIEMIKKTVIGAAGAVALMGAVSAQAVTVSPGTGPSNSYLFSGSNVTLSQGDFDLNCNLDLEGYAEVDGDELTVTVTDGESSGGLFGLCALVSFEFPWVATSTVTSTANDVSVNGVFTGVDVTGPGGQCGTGNDSVPAVFDYVNPTSQPYSSFTFNASIGNCGVQGTVTETTGNLLVTNP